MGMYPFITGCCKEPWWEGWEDYTYCENCVIPICHACLEAWDEDWYEKFFDEDLGELAECPCCDQFRHMNAEYCP